MFDQTAQINQIQKAIFNELGPESGCRVYLYGSRALGSYDRFEPVLLAIESPHSIDTELLGYLQMTANEAAGPLSVHITEYNCLSPESQWQIRREAIELFPKGQKLYKL